MATVQVRPFRRSDRDQLTRLVNRHVAAVMPGASVSVNTVLSQLEREPSEFIVDPWVTERITLVAEQNGSLVAAALLHRFGCDSEIPNSYQDRGEIRWFVFWPMAPDGNPFWQDGHEAADVLMDACIAHFDAWSVKHQSADGTLPHPGVYGVPAQWPHIEDLYQRHGFRYDADAGSHTEIVLMLDLDRFAADPRGDAWRTVTPANIELRRLLGINGTRFEARSEGDVVGLIELEQLDVAERHRRNQGLADIGNLHVAEPHRRQGIGRRLLVEAADWLRLGGVDRLLAYLNPADDDGGGELAFLSSMGFVEITVTRRGWSRDL